MALQQIIYTSHSLVPMSSDELVALLSQSRRRNAAAGISGLLLHADGNFMQTIEGEAEAVHALFARIEGDKRHEGLILICDEPIAQRSYGEWSMAFREIGREDAAKLQGFARHRHAISAEDRDLARNLMATFLKTAGLTR